MCNQNGGKDPLGNDLSVSSESNVLGVLDGESESESESESLYHIRKHLWLETKQPVAPGKKCGRKPSNMTQKVNHSNQGQPPKPINDYDPCAQCICFFFLRLFAFH